MTDGSQVTRQFLVYPAAGKRIMARSLVAMPGVEEALESGTVVIIAGTTNGYIAEEILDYLGEEADSFSKKNFYRGVTLPPRHSAIRDAGVEADRDFPGDVVIVNGRWEKGKTVVDVADDLEQGDIIIKGANALNVSKRQAAIYIGHPRAGTINVAMQAVMGRRVRLILPVGLEKRVPGDVHHLARKVNSCQATGPRLMPVDGEIVTELEAIHMLTGVEAELVAAGGVGGAEGSYWLAVSGSEEQVGEAEEIIQAACTEPRFEL